MKGFNRSDITRVFALAKGLGACKQHGGWFNGLNRYNVYFESIEYKNDTLNLSDCHIQKIEVEIPTIAGKRKSAKFRVFVAQYTPSGSYWEPDDMDIVEAGVFDSLHEAFSHFYVMQAQTFARDNAMATLYEENKKVEEDV